MRITKWFAAATAAALLVTSLVTATPARAEYTKDIRRYRVAFTNGHGLRLRTGPSTSAPGYGDGNYILPDGAWFSGECEANGDMITNPYGESTDVWMRTPGGYFVSEAFLNTGTNDPVGLPVCAAMDAQALAEVTPRTVSSYHRDGVGVVKIANPRDTEARFYYSKKKTQEISKVVTTAVNSASAAGNVLCATVGVVLGIVITKGAAVSAIAGFTTDVLCSAFTAAIIPKDIQEASNALNAAAAGGGCFETRAHRDSTDQEWTVDVFTATDSADYCG